MSKKYDGRLRAICAGLAILVMCICAGCEAGETNNRLGYVTAEDLIYQGVTVGVTTEAQLQSLLGEASRIDKTESSHYYTYGSVVYRVATDTETVCQITILGDDAKEVYPGIGVGVSVEEVLTIFPDAEISKVDTEDQTLNIIMAPSEATDALLYMYFDDEHRLVNKIIINTYI